jgi:hypothetical protein
MLDYIVKVHEKEEGHDGTQNATFIALQVDILQRNVRRWRMSSESITLLQMPNTRLDLCSQPDDQHTGMQLDGNLRHVGIICS